MSDTITSRCFENTLAEPCPFLSVDEINAQIAKFDLMLSENPGEANESSSIYSGGPGTGLAALWALNDAKAAEYYLTSEKNVSWADKEAKRGEDTHAVSVGGGVATALFYTVVVLHHIFANHKKNPQSVHGSESSLAPLRRIPTSETLAMAHGGGSQQQALAADAVSQLETRPGAASGVPAPLEAPAEAAPEPAAAMPPKPQKTGISKLRSLVGRRSSSALKGGENDRESGRRVTNYQGETHDNFVMLEGVLLSATHRILQVRSSVCKSDEWLYGRTGFLFALLFVRKQFRVKGGFATPELARELNGEINTKIRHVVEEIVNSGRAYGGGKKSALLPPLCYEWHGKQYTGGAHGLAGIYYMLLQAREFLTNTELQDLKDSVDFVMTRCCDAATGNYCSKVGSMGAHLVQFCHGAPGFIPLFVEAHATWKEEKYLREAARCGEVVWKFGLLKKSAGLCHGIAGNAFFFLSLYRALGDERWLQRAHGFARVLMADAKEDIFVRQPDRPLSLFEGCAGVMLFFHALKDPGNARFPMYEV